MNFWAYFKKKTGPGPRSPQKSYPGSLEKVDPILKITVWIKNSILTNSRVLISDMTLDF